LPEPSTAPAPVPVVTPIPPEHLPSAEDFYLHTPLYEFYKLNVANRDQIQQLQYYKGTFDAYCVECGQVSIFERVGSSEFLTPVRAMEDRAFGLHFKCRRDPNHLPLYFLFRVASRQIGKIGQYPSLADLHTTRVAKYRKLLGDQRYRELVRGIGLAAHGIGIGSFAYIRRVFESLVEEAHQQVAAAGGLDEGGYQRSRMDERILLLRASLPPFLVENRSLYGILSKGLHELTEEECLRYFATVEMGIELILDEKLETRKRDEKLKEAAKAIGELRGKLGG
jgi:hypothetical protein